MILRLKSEIFHTKPTLWITSSDEEEEDERLVFGERERKRERE